jgi:predicted dienelactone hydrolase/intracellular septation protein A
MKQALSHLLADFLSALLFLVVYLASGSITAAAAIAIAAGLAQFGARKFAGRRIEPMQWISLVLVLVLSAATMLTQSPRFVMIKPSIVHLAIAAVMLRRGWMLRYLPEIARRNLPESVPVAAGYAWAGLMAALGLANLAIAVYGDMAMWAWFISVGAIGAKVAAFLLQYAVFRMLIRRRLASAGTPVAGEGAMRPSALLPAIAAGAILFGMSGGAGAVGFQQLTIPDPQGESVRLNIWYPSDAPAAAQPLGLFRQTVALDGAIAGSRLPLIVLSHGTGGSAEGHYDTALALAEAGFIAVAITHTGDNWRDHRYSFTQRNFTERPRHIKLTIDFLLTEWSGRDHIAAERVGGFGHSAGGSTMLIAIGGEPDFGRAVAFCQEHPEDWGCQRARERAAGAPSDAPPAPVWTHDPRIKAAVIAAPGLGQAFTSAGLAAVAVPVQLWQAEDDRVAVNRWSSDIVKARLPLPPEAHLVPRAGHFAFLAPCSTALAELAAEICRDPPGFDRTAFHREFNAATVEFFAKSLPRAELSR